MVTCNHTGGVGNFSEGFTRIVEDGRLRSPLGVYLLEEEKEKAVANFFRLEEFKDNRQQVDFFLDRLIASDQNGGGSYADKTAVHFATEEVADYYYGSEQGNEIFFAYPSAYIASQYYFRGQLKEKSGEQYNDQWVWDSEQKGMNINAGLVFVPKEARVNRETGSRYELDDQRNAIENSEYFNQIKNLTDAKDFVTFSSAVLDIIGKVREAELSKQLQPFLQRIESEFGIKDPRLIKAVFDYQNLSKLNLQKRSDEAGKDIPGASMTSTIRQIMQGAGVRFLETKDSISSEEYWEAYFSKHPDKRPSKLVYYEGQDPTAALLKWREENGLSKKAKDEHIGFPEHRVHLGKNSQTGQITAGLDRFKSLAEKVIEDYFSEVR